MESVIKILREQNRYTQTKLAEVLGISRPALINYENLEQDLPISVVKALSKLFNVSYECLIDNKLPKTEDEKDKEALDNYIMQLFGMTYVEDFLGLGTVIMNASVPKGKVYATAKENIVLYYIPVNGADLGEAFNFTSDETGYIGIHEAPDYTNMTASDTVVNGMVFFAERIDGVIVADLGVLVVGNHVGHRCEVQVEAQLRQLLRHGLAHLIDLQIGGIVQALSGDHHADVPAQGRADAVQALVEDIDAAQAEGLDDDALVAHFRQYIENFRGQTGGQLQ